MRVADGRALVGTVDFIMPLVDEPRLFGAIAAANAVSDIHAMGARPLFALSIVCFPEKAWPLEVLAEILAGGAEKLGEASCPVIGGHSVADEEMKFGYSITGTVAEDALWRNAGARPGDELVLTKRLGTGILATAARARRELGEAWTAAVEQMTTLNALPVEALPAGVVHAATDITGFGLAGHACELARASDVTLRLRPERLPLLDGALHWAAAGQLTRARQANRDYVEREVRLGSSVDAALREVFYDPQTSGGLLLAVDPEAGAVQRLRDAGGSGWSIGTVEPPGDARIILE